MLTLGASPRVFVATAALSPAARLTSTERINPPGNTHVVSDVGTG